MRHDLIRTYTYTVRDYTDLRIAVSKVQKLPFVSAANELDRSLIGTILSELGSNIIKYADYGMVIVSLVDHPKGQGVEIIAKDDGPGIPNIELALRDHFTTGKSLGLGLPGVKRMSDRFSIRSTPTSGTVVSALKLLGARQAEPQPNGARGTGASVPSSAAQPISMRWEIGAAVRPMRGQINGGDLVIAWEDPDFLLLMIVDVTGHGERAHDVALQIKTVVEANASLPMQTLMATLDRFLQGSAGAAVGMMRIDRGANSFRYLGVGNTGVARVRDKKWRGISKDGVVGERMPVLFEQTEALSPGDVFLMWTDGISELAGPRHLENNLREPVQLVANRLVHQLGTPHDDAGCAILKWIG